MALTANTMIALEWSFITLTFILTALRLYLRLYLRRRRGWRMVSDIFVLLAWLFFLAQASMDTVLLNLGLFAGKIDPAAEMDAFGKNGLGPRGDTVTALKLLFTESVLYYGAMYMVKFAMLAFYYELFPKVLPGLRKSLFWTTVITTATWIATIAIKIFICQPIRGNWSTGEEYCPSMFSIVSNGLEWAMHVATDIAIYLLPLFLLPHLKLPMSQKIGVGITFSLGFVCIAFANIVQVALMNPVPTPLTWLYSALEQTWAIIVVCCPAFKFFLTRDMRKSWRSFTGRMRSSNSGSRSVNKARIVNGALVSDVIEIIGDSRMDPELKSMRNMRTVEESPSPPESRSMPTIHEKEPESPSTHV